MKFFVALVVVAGSAVAGLAVAGGAEPGDADEAAPVVAEGPVVSGMAAHGAGARGYETMVPGSAAGDAALPLLGENPGLADDGTGSSVEVPTAVAAVSGPPPDSRGWPRFSAGEASSILPAPTGLACSATSSSIVFSWNAVTGADDYTAKLQLAVPGSAQTVKKTAGTSVVFSGLNSETRFYLGVHSNVGDVPQYYSGVYCTTRRRPLDAPTGLVCPSRTSTSIEFSWNAVAGADDYTARVLDGLPGTVLASRRTTTSSVEFTGLSPFTSYNLSVRANRAGETQHWTGIWCSTSAAPPVCGAVDTDSVELRWQAEDVVRQWYAARATTGDSYTDGRVLDALVLSTEFTGLSRNTTYVFYFWWRASGSWVQVHPSVSCTTSALAVPAVPAGLECSAEATAIDFSWDAVAAADSYTARVALSGSVLETVNATEASARFSGLSQSTSYTLNVRSERGGLSSSWADLSCATPAAVLLPPPTGLGCSARTASITLGWGPVEGADRYRASVDDGTTWVETAFTFRTFVSLDADTLYSLSVQAHNAAGWGASGDIDCRTSPETSVVVPSSAPADPVVHCGAATTTSVSWTWDAVDGATGYQYRYHRTSSDDDWESIAATSHTLGGLSAGRGSRFYLRAVNAAGPGAEEYQYCYTRPSASAPPIPGEPKPTCVSTTTEIAYTWRSVLHADYYQVQHAGTRFRWVRFDDPSDDTTTAFTLTGQSANRRPLLNLRAVNATGNGQTHRPNCRTLANPPTGLTVACANNTEGAPVVTVSWSAVTGAERYQAVVRRLGTLPNGQPRPDTVNSSDSGVLSFTVPGWYGKAYQARVQLLTEAGWSELSEPVAATCPISVACSVSENSLVAIWSEKEGATRYRVSRGSTWVDATGTSHLFAGLVASTAYTIRVQAGDADGWGDIASKSCATIAPLLPAPANLVCTAVTATAVTLSWDAVTGAGGYTARISAGAQGAVTTANTSATFSSLAPVRDYYVSVHANKSGSPQRVSGTTCTTTDLLPAPASLACSATATTITLSWAAVAGATGYAAKVQLAEPGSTQTVQSTTSSSATFASLAASTDYYLSVHANKNSVPQRYSGVVCATTPPAPASIRCSVSASSMTVSWDEADGAAKYRVDHGTASDTTTDWEEAAEASHLIIGLEPSTAYTIKVQAGSSGGWGGTATTSCSTIAVPGVPATCAGTSGSNHCLDSADTITITPQPSGQNSANTARSTVTLKRIVANRDITTTLPNGTTVTIVKAGEKGGYAENSSNIGSSGWVFSGARVLGRAQVFDGGSVAGNALISGYAQVYGGALVTGRARVSGQSKIYDHALVYGSARVSGNARVHGFGTRVYDDARICASNSPITGMPYPCNFANVRGSAWVYDDAKVYGSALVGPIRAFGAGPEIHGYARVFDNANINGVAAVYGFARIHGFAEVGGNARVFGSAKVYGTDDSHGRTHQSGDDSDDRGGRVIGFSRVFGSANIAGNATINGAYSRTRAAEVFGKASVYGNATVSGFAKVFGDVDIYGDASVRDEAQIFDTVQVYDDAQVYGHARVFSYAASSEVVGKRNLSAGEEPTYRAVFDTNDPARKFWNNSSIVSEQYSFRNTIAHVEQRVSDSAIVQLQNPVWDEITMGKKPAPLTSTKIYGEGKVSGDAHVWGGSRIAGTAKIKNGIRVSGSSYLHGGTFCGTLWVNSIPSDVGGTSTCNRDSSFFSISKIGCFAGSGLAVALGWGATPSLALATACFFVG